MNYPITQKLKEASTFFRGYIFEITNKKQKIESNDFLTIIKFLRKNVDLDVKSFIHYSFNLSVEEKKKKKQELRFSVDDIFCDISINLFLSGRDIKNYLSKYDFSFLNDFDFDRVLAFDEDEMNRALYYNEDNGLIWCISNTSGFSKESKYCTGCNFMKKCLMYKVKSV
jgi:hypothetical protein